MTLGTRGWTCGLAFAIAVLGCGSPKEAESARLPVSSLHLVPLTDLAAAAELEWLVTLRPREIAAHAELLPAIERMVPLARRSAFSTRNGGIDLLSISELAVAGYPSSTLWLAHTSLDPGRVEQAFVDRAVHIDGRAIDWGAGDPLARVVRTWGLVGADREQLVVLGREAVALEVGHFGPLRVAELFAEGRLKRASPALAASPLREARARLRDAPLQAFAPGPFSGEFAHGLGGLLSASTAVAADAAIAEELTGRPSKTGLACRFVVLGAWGEQANDASERLLAIFQLIADSGIGRLLKIDHPLAPARVHADADALILEVTFDAEALASGLHEATGATVDEMMEH